MTTTFITTGTFILSLILIYGGFEYRKSLIRKKKVIYHNAICDSKIIGVGVVFTTISLILTAYGIYTLSLFQDFVTFGMSVEASLALVSAMPAITTFVVAGLLEGFGFYEDRHKENFLKALAIAGFILCAAGLIWGGSKLDGEDNLYVIATYGLIGMLMIEFFELSSEYFKKA